MFPQSHPERIHINQRALPRATAPTDGTTITEISQETTRGADARLSLARVAFNLCIVVKWSGYVQQRTDATVDCGAVINVGGT